MIKTQLELLREKTGFSLSTCATALDVCGSYAIALEYLILKSSQPKAVVVMPGGYVESWNEMDYIGEATVRARQGTWVFTFGCGQALGGRFIKIRADNYGDARNAMVEMYSTAWAFQYDEYQWEDVIKRWDEEGRRYPLEHQFGDVIDVRKGFDHVGLHSE